MCQEGSSSNNKVVWLSKKVVLDRKGAFRPVARLLCSDSGPKSIQLFRFLFGTFVFTGQPPVAVQSCKQMPRANQLLSHWSEITPEEVSSSVLTPEKTKITEHLQRVWLVCFCG